MHLEEPDTTVLLAAVEGCFFAARSAGQSTPIFPTMTIFIWAANCAWLASSGVWDDCLEVGGRWCHGGGSVRTFAPKGSHLPIPM